MTRARNGISQWLRYCDVNRCPPVVCTTSKMVGIGGRILHERFCMSASTIGLAILLIGVLALIGIYIRARSRTVQKLFLPVSLIAGFLALFFGPQVFGRVGGGLGWDGVADRGLFGSGVVEVWGELPGLLISVVFAGLFLGTRLPSPKRAVKLLGPQLSLGVTFAAGQYVVGMLLVVAVLVPLFKVTPMFGALIEMGFEGGHGTAAGMAPVMEELGFEGGGDLALAMATVGILSGVVIDRKSTRLNSSHVASSYAVL